MRAIAHTIGAVLLGGAASGCAGAPPSATTPTGSPESDSSVEANDSMDGRRPPEKPKLPSPEKQPTDVERSFKEAEVVIDIAGALVHTTEGGVRISLANWLILHAHARADRLRARAAEESPERRDALVGLANAVDVFERPGWVEATGEDDIAGMSHAAERAEALFPRSSPPAAESRTGWLEPESIQLVVRMSFDRFRDCCD
jgi:hypothetical protein